MTLRGVVFRIYRSGKDVEGNAMRGYRIPTLRIWYGAFFTLSAEIHSSGKRFVAGFSLNMNGGISDKPIDGFLLFHDRRGDTALARRRSDGRASDPQARGRQAIGAKPPERTSACEVFRGVEYPEQETRPKERDHGTVSTDHQEDDGKFRFRRLPRHRGSFREGFLPRRGSRILRTGGGLLRLHPRCRSRVPEGLGGQGTDPPRRGDPGHGAAEEDRRFEDGP